MARPHFTIKNIFQKRTETYQDILTNDILRDVCYRITGRRGFTVVLIIVVITRVVWQH